jgi:hypothetical protein
MVALMVWGILFSLPNAALSFGVLLGVTFLVGIGVVLWDLCQHPRGGSLSYDLGVYNFKIMDLNYFVPPGKIKEEISEHVENPLEEYMGESIQDAMSGSITVVLSKDPHQNMVTTFGDTRDQIIVCDASCVLEEEMFDLITLAICNMVYPYKVTSKGNATENLKWLKQRGLVEQHMEASCLKG